ncbi:MAG: hypothetical protein M9962_05345 [Oligoflexia bacterium]|nr:hypothetical protein [Oligoflexia bacterium]
MRQLIKHIAAILFLVFVFRLAMQATDDRQVLDVPKSVLLSRMAPTSAMPTQNEEIKSVTSGLKK